MDVLRSKDSILCCQDWGSLTFLGRNSAHDIAMKLKIKSKKARTVARPKYYMPTQIEYTPSYLKRVDSPGQQAHISESFKILDKWF